MRKKGSKKRAFRSSDLFEQRMRWHVKRFDSKLGRNCLSEWHLYQD